MIKKYTNLLIGYKQDLFINLDRYIDLISKNTQINNLGEKKLI